MSAGELLDEKDILEKATDIPRNCNCAIYFLIRENKIVYIGRAVEVYGRLRNQQGRITFDKVYIHKCDRSDLNRVEREYIHKYQPLVNKLTTNKDIPTVQMDMDVSPEFKKSVSEICYTTRTSQAALFDYFLVLYKREEAYKEDDAYRESLQEKRAPVGMSAEEYVQAVAENEQAAEEHDAKTARDGAQ